MKYYADLSEERDAFELDPAPVEGWVIVSFEFPILVGREKFILATQPYYGSIFDKANTGEGILYPPFSATKLDFGFFKPRTLGAARKAALVLERDLLSERSFQQLAYNLGLGEPEFEVLKPLDELKISPRDHNVHKYFRLYRVRAWSETYKGKRNIADPEFIKGHFHVPLALPPKWDVPETVRGPHEYRFKSKILASHFSLISRYYYDDNKREKYTQFDHDDFVTSEDGLIVAFDISGFGNLNYDTISGLSNPLESGVAIAEKFRVRIVSIFEEFCDLVGTSQLRVMGDGFVCGCPLRFFAYDVSILVDRLLTAWSRLTFRLDEMNALLPPGARRLGSRLVLVAGRYQFGRIGGPSATVADFDGDVLIKAARHEQFLGKFMRDNKITGRHLVAIAEPDSLGLVEALRAKSFTDTDVNGNEKESAVKMTVMRMTTDETGS